MCAFQESIHILKEQSNEILVTFLDRGQLLLTASFSLGGSPLASGNRDVLVLLGSMCQHGVRAKMPDSPEPSNKLQSTFADQRAAPRFTFIASVELTDALNEVRMSGRISEISRNGCFVDILNTLPVGTLIQIRIVRDQGILACPGRIVYAQEPMGMGIAFVDVPADQQKTLDEWVAELSSGQ